MRSFRPSLRSPTSKPRRGRCAPSQNRCSYDDTRRNLRYRRYAARLHGGSGTRLRRITCAPAASHRVPTWTTRCVSSAWRTPRGILSGRTVLCAQCRRSSGEVGGLVTDFYRLHVQLKPGAAALLAALTRRGVKLCAATSGDGRSPVPRSSAAAFCRASAGCLPVPRSAAARTRRRFTRRRGHIWARPRVKPPCSRTRFTPCKPRNGPGFTPSPSQTRPPVGTGRRCAHPQTST